MGVSQAHVNDDSLAATRHLATLLARAPGFLAFGPGSVWLKVAWLQTCRLKQVFNAMFFSQL